MYSVSSTFLLPPNLHLQLQMFFVSLSLFHCLMLDVNNISLASNANVIYGQKGKKETESNRGNQCNSLLRNENERKRDPKKENLENDFDKTVYDNDFFMSISNS